MNEKLSHIRNFTIIAHIDHGKSTLADRMLEFTGTIEKRKMKEQVLDQMELERERGITIKMQPVRMQYNPQFPNNGEPKTENSKIKNSDSAYILNLIDTPGHIDFSYEVSRALHAVEGSVLLVDATQGVQAQTLSVLAMARASGLVIIPVVSKIDSPLARTEEVKEEVAKLLSCDISDVFAVSGRTGEGVEMLLGAIIAKIPPPREEYPDSASARALVFDFSYSAHKGVVVYVKIWDGEVKKGDALIFLQTKKQFIATEVGSIRAGAHCAELSFSGVNRLYCYRREGSWDCLGGGHTDTRKETATCASRIYAALAGGVGVSVHGKPGRFYAS